MRRAAALVALIVLVSAVALVAAAGSDERELAFSLGVGSQAPVAVAKPAGEVCQAGVHTDSRFDVVRLVLGTYARPGPELGVTVRDARTGRTLAAGRLPAGARDNQSARARVSPAVPAERRVDVCFRNRGAHRVAFYGGVPWAEPLSTARVDGRRLTWDLRLDFFRSDSRSALSLVPDMFERAALFMPPGVGSWTYWCLLAVVAVLVPLLLGAALARAVDDV
jgi:hypothetical protein